MEQKRVFFPFLPLDYKAAEQWLNEQAREGWALKKLGWRYALLERASTPHQAPRQYAAMLYAASTAWEMRPYEQERLQEYIEFVEGCGWEYAAHYGMLHVFAAPEGTPPLQSDPVAEATEVRQFLKNRLAISLLLLGLGLLLAFVIIGGGAFVLGMSLNCTLFCVLTVFGGIAAFIFRVAQLGLLARRLRRAEKEAVFLPARSIPRARLRGTLLTAGAGALVLLYIACMAADLLIDFRNYTRVYMFLVYPLGPVLGAYSRRFKKTRQRIMAMLAAISLIVLLGAGALVMQEKQISGRETTRIYEAPVLLMRPLEEVDHSELHIQRSPLVYSAEYIENPTAGGYMRSQYVRCATRRLANGAYTELLKNLSSPYANQPPYGTAVDFPGVERAALWSNGSITGIVLQKGGRVLRVTYSRQSGFTWEDAAFQENVLRTFFSG